MGNFMKDIMQNKPEHEAPKRDFTQDDVISDSDEDAEDKTKSQYLREKKKVKRNEF